MSAPDATTEEPFLDDGRIRRALNLCSGLMIATVAAAVAWAIATPVDEVAKAPGAVVPVGDIQVVDSRDGGLVREVLVREGMEVRQGDVLLRFDPVRSAADLAAAVAGRAAHEIAVERLTAFIEDRTADFSRFAQEFPNLVVREEAALAAQRGLLEADLLALRQQAVAKEAQLAALQEQIPAFEQELEAVTTARGIIEGLAARGLASQLRLADLIEQQARVNRAFAEAKGQRMVVQGQLQELAVAMEARRSRARTEAAEKRVEAGAQLRSLGEQIALLQDRVRNATVAAPVAGLIQSLPAPRAGMVVNPGEPVAHIVPSGEVLLFEARLSPRDVGFVAPGQPAKVKVDAFDFSRFGALAGTVDSVSATTVADPRQPPYYRMRIRLDRAALGAGGTLRLQAGMTGEADVRTGSRTVFQYLWKPIYTSLDLAFTER